LETRKQSGVRTTAASRLLLVEDDRMMARALSRTLGGLGFEIELVRSVADAKRLDPSVWTEGTFTCGIFDIDLPDGSGVDVAKKLLEDGLVRTVIFFSASTDVEVTIEAQRLGAFVSKLDGLAVLLRVLSKVLPPRDGACRWQDAPGAAQPEAPPRHPAVQMAAVRLPKR
jgi:DNA-binding response OmpR family regulator